MFLHTKHMLQFSELFSGPMVEFSQETLRDRDTERKVGEVLKMDQNDASASQGLTDNLQNWRDTKKISPSVSIGSKSLSTIGFEISSLQNSVSYLGCLSYLGGTFVLSCSLENE